MTDFIRIINNGKTYNIQISSWPPPETLWLHEGMLHNSYIDNAQILTRRIMSELTDEQMAEMTHVARGAVYVPEDQEWDGRT